MTRKLLHLAPLLFSYFIILKISVTSFMIYLQIKNMKLFGIRFYLALNCVEALVKA